MSYLKSIQTLLANDGIQSVINSHNNRLIIELGMFHGGDCVLFVDCPNNEVSEIVLTFDVTTVEWTDCYSIDASNFKENADHLAGELERAEIRRLLESDPKQLTLYCPEWHVEELADYVSTKAWYIITKVTDKVWLDYLDSEFCLDPTSWKPLAI